MDPRASLFTLVDEDHAGILERLLDTPSRPLILLKKIGFVSQSCGFRLGRNGAVEFSADELEDDLSTLAVAYQRSAKKLEMLSRYETGIVRRLRNAERELERLQTLRIGQAAADATVIDAMDVKRKKN